jgi:hypothetical protein
MVLSMHIHTPLALLKSIPLTQRLAGMSKKTKSCPIEQLREASTGFEPVIRVLQTLALPLGHDAI